MRLCQVCVPSLSLRAWGSFLTWGPPSFSPHLSEDPHTCRHLVQRVAFGLCTMDMNTVQIWSTPGVGLWTQLAAT